MRLFLLFIFICISVSFSSSQELSVIAINTSPRISAMGGEVNAIIDRDYPIVIGFMTIGLIIKLLGNLLSDICYALIDPRIRFK